MKRTKGDVHGKRAAPLHGPDLPCGRTADLAFYYTDGDPQPSSWNRWAAGQTGFGSSFSYIEILEELVAWDINAQPHVGWNLLLRAQNGDADFILSAVNVDG
ncbi:MULTISPECIES: hypothetical protein [unclassified Streptomyces]|uniref:hypothetical protein n=1 Tax=unclassified Streptomyces TaxID=2593676 RepID=UPI0038044445